MKILITGGAGFIGSHIADAMIKDGMEVVVVDDLSSGRMENVNTAAKFYEADIRDKHVLDIFMAETPDVVSHHAAQVSVRDSVADPCRDADINITGSLNVLECCRRSGVGKVVFASSGGAVYGEQDAFPAGEDHPANPLSPYGAAKLAVEKYLYIYEKVHGIRYAALRYSNVYGPRQDPHGEAGVVAIFSALILAGEEPTVNGDGEQTRDYVYVADVARANILALGEGAYGAYNIGTGIETSVNALYGMMKSASGFQGKEKHGPAKPGEQRRSVLDCSRISSELGWEPAVPLEQGLALTLEYFRSKA